MLDLFWLHRIVVNSIISEALVKTSVLQIKKLYCLLIVLLFGFVFILFLLFLSFFFLISSLDFQNTGSYDPQVSQRHETCRIYKSFLG